jgi:hypothetical protein
MLARTLRRRTSRSTSSRGRPRPPRLTLEALEDRIVPAGPVDLGPLRFLGDYSQVGKQYTFNGGDVQLGLKPASAEAFVKLLNFHLAPDANHSTPGVLSLYQNNPTNFRFIRATV